MGGVYLWVTMGKGEGHEGVKRGGQNLSKIVLSFYESKLIKIEASKIGNFVRVNVTVGSEPVYYCVGLGSKMLGCYCYAHPVTKIGSGYFNIKTLLPLQFSAKLVLHGRKAKNKTLFYFDPCRCCSSR